MIPYLAARRARSGSDPAHPDLLAERRVRRLLGGPRAFASIFAIALVALAVGCGGDDSDSASDSGAATTSGSSSKAFTPSPGTDIPKVSVRFAMWPYGDTTIAVPGIEQGWFEESGIALPNGKKTVTIKQGQQQLLNNQLDIASGYVPNTIQVYATAKNIKMLDLTNAYIGNYIWSNPKNNDKALADVPDGDFTAKAKVIVAQMKGRRVALSDSGSNREFFNTIMKMGGLTTKDLAKLDVVDDTKIVQLARAGSIDYAFPAGAAQSVEVQGMGFKDLFGFVDMVDGLPKGDPRVLNGIGHAGLQASQEYIDKNRETVLRFMGVQYRIIDELQNKPAQILKYSLPTLRTSTGVDLTLEQSEALFKDFYGTVNFDQQADLLLNPDYPLYYQSVYKSQIAAAVAGGIVPKDLNLTPDDMIVQKSLYEDLVSLKKQYDELKSSKAPKGELADKAAVFYSHFNYLDAYRYLKAASEAA
jgi:ABC-type nitrate/sulfonate/bicarbonate transport system substrate-binding protein